MARSIPIAPMRFPRTAVLGWARPLKARMKQTAEIR